MRNSKSCHTVKTARDYDPIANSTCDETPEHPLESRYHYQGMVLHKMWSDIRISVCKMRMLNWTSIGSIGGSART